MASDAPEEPSQNGDNDENEQEDTDGSRQPEQRSGLGDETESGDRRQDQLGDDGLEKDTHTKRSSAIEPKENAPATRNREVKPDRDVDSSDYQPNDRNSTKETRNDTDTDDE